MRECAMNERSSGASRTKYVDPTERKPINRTINRARMGPSETSGCDNVREECKIAGWFVLSSAARLTAHRP